jgi:hypothetical protein
MMPCDDSGSNDTAASPAAVRVELRSARTPPLVVACRPGCNGRLSPAGRPETGANFMMDGYHGWW